MSLPLEIIVKGNVDQATTGLQKVQTELGKTAVAAQKTDSSLQKLSSSGGQSIAQLTTKLKNLTTSVFTEKDTSKIANYKVQIEETKNEINSLLSNIKGSSVNAFSQFESSGVTAIQEIGNKLKGLADPVHISEHIISHFGRELATFGSLAIASFAIEPVVKWVESLFEASEAEKKLAEERVARIKEYNSAVDSAVKNVAKEATEVISLVAILNNENESRIRKLSAIKELQQIEPEIFANLKLEGNTVIGLTSAYDKYVASLKTVIAAQIIKSQLDAKITELLKIQGAENTKQQQEQLDNFKKAIASSERLSQIKKDLQDTKLGGGFLTDKQEAQRVAQLNDEITGLVAKLTELSKGIKITEIKINPEKITLAKDPRIFNSLIKDITAESLKTPFEPQIFIKPKFTFLESANFTKEMTEAAKAQTAIIQGIYTEAFIGLGEAIGNSIAGKGNFFGNLFGAIFKALGAGIRQLGVYAVATSKLIQTIRTYLGTSLGIAGGVALIALGTLISAAAAKIQAPKFASGVRGFSGGSALVGERGPERIFLPTGSSVQPNNELNAYGGGQMVFIPAITLRGPDLVIAFNRAQQAMGRNN